MLDSRLLAQQKWFVDKALKIVHITSFLYRGHMYVYMSVVVYILPDPKTTFAHKSLTKTHLWPRAPQGSTCTINTECTCNEKKKKNGENDTEVGFELWASGVTAVLQHAATRATCAECGKTLRRVIWAQIKALYVHLCLPEWSKGWHVASHCTGRRQRQEAWCRMTRNCATVCRATHTHNT